MLFPLEPCSIHSKHLLVTHSVPEIVLGIVHAKVRQLTGWCGDRVMVMSASTMGPEAHKDLVLCSWREWELHLGNSCDLQGKCESGRQVGKVKRYRGSREHGVAKQL